MLAGIAATGEPADAFLLGVDLVKDRARIHAAYNDGQGVTEAFVRNGLDGVNRELGADLEQERLAFEARWDAQEEWIDIGLLARERSRSRSPSWTASPFEKGEKLRLEVSSKFRREAIEQELAAAGLQLVAWWTDAAASSRCCWLHATGETAERERVTAFLARRRRTCGLHAQLEEARAVFWFASRRCSAAMRRCARSSPSSAGSARTS